LSSTKSKRVPIGPPVGKPRISQSIDTSTALSEPDETPTAFKTETDPAIVSIDPKDIRSAIKHFVCNTEAVRAQAAELAVQCSRICSARGVNALARRFRDRGEYRDALEVLIQALGPDAREFTEVLKESLDFKGIEERLNEV
jgi:hypothetical protein